MAKILIAFDTIAEGFELLASQHELKFPPKGRDFTQEELLELIDDYDVLCSVFDISVQRELIDKGKNLKLIANYAVGYNNIDVKYAQSRGIVVCNTPKSVVEPTADLAFSLMLSCTRRLAEWDRRFRNERERISRNRLSHFGSDTYGKTLGIIGYGNIGAAVARRALAFGMKVIYNKRHKLSQGQERELNLSFAEKEEIFRTADVISLHTPYSEETHHLVGKEELEMMKSTAYLINTSRGAVVDEQALILALKEKRIAAAGLDVFEINDFPQSELFDLENVTLTPHIGTQTYDARLGMVNELVDNVLGFLNNDRPIAIVKI